MNTCPSCGSTEVQSTTCCGLHSPLVKAWSCSACQLEWAITVVNPGLFIDRLIASVEERSMLQQVITLADDAPTLPDHELRDRLLALVEEDFPYSRNPGRPPVDIPPSGSPAADRPFVVRH